MVAYGNEFAYCELFVSESGHNGDALDFLLNVRRAYILELLAHWERQRSIYSPLLSSTYPAC